MKWQALALAFLLAPHAFAGDATAPGASCDDPEKPVGMQQAVNGGFFVCSNASDPRSWLAQPVYVGTSAATCDGTKTALTRYNAGAIEVCNGAAWVGVGSGASVVLGSTATGANPYRSGDVTTGLFSPAASTVAIATAGAEALRVTATGGVAFSNATASITGKNNTGAGQYGGDLAISAGGSPSYIGGTGGGNLTLAGGNGHSLSSGPDVGGSVFIYAGYNAQLPSYKSGQIKFFTKNAEVLRIDPDGNVGIGTTTPTNLLSIGGGSARTFWMERTTTGTAGNSLTVQSGGALSGATNASGGDLVLSSGISTGTGTSKINFQTATATGTGTADSSPTTKMTILGNGNVGIGTATPSYTLDVRTISSSGAVAIWDGSNGMSLGRFAIARIGVTPAAFNFLSFPNYSFDAAVGIGTTSPTNLLSLGGNTARTFWMERTTTGAAGNSLTVQSGGALSGATNASGGDLVLSSGISTGTGTSKINFQTVTATSTGTADSSPTTKMTILGNGNVGIGTTSPQNNLHVYSTVSAGGISIDGTASPGLNLNSNGTSRGYLGVATSSGAYVTGSSANDIGLQISSTNSFLIGTGGVGGVFFTVKSAGNVGIGTTSPSYILDITSTGGMRIPVGTTAQRPTGAQGVIRYNSTTGSGLLEYHDGTDWQSLIASGANSVLGNTATGANPYRSGDVTTGLFSPAASTVAISTAGTEALRVTATGSVGIGTTSPTKALTVNGSISFIGSSNALRGLVGTPTWDTSFISIQNGTMTESSLNAALYQDSQGNTSVNAAVGRRLSFAIGGFSVGGVDSSGNLVVGGYDNVALPPTSQTLRGANAFAADTAGGTLTIQSGLATGNASSGNIIFNGAPVGSSGSTLQTAATYLTIKAGGSTAGNVGIGTSSPSSILTVDPQGAGKIIVGNPNLSSGGYTSLQLGISAGSNGYSYLQSTEASGSINGFLALNGLSNLGGTGVGTTAPINGAPFTVVGANATLSIMATAANNYSGINMFDDNGTLAASFQYGNASSGVPNAMFMGTRIANAPLVFMTGAGTNERMRIDAAGAVGIGTTTPQATLDVNGYARLAKQSASPVACAASNDGAIALTSQYTFCACKGASTAWVRTTDGTTACTW